MVYSISNIQATASQPCGSEHDKRVEVDLPLSLLDQLLASEIVPLGAKIKSIESWQEELAEARSSNPLQIELERRLAEAKRTLLKRNRLERLISPITSIARWGARLAFLSRRAHSKAVRPAGIFGTVATARSPVTGL